MQVSSVFVTKLESECVLRCSAAPFAASIKLDMPGKEILGSSGDEGCDILRCGEYGMFEGY